MTIKKDGELVMREERRGSFYYLQTTMILVGDVLMQTPSELGT